MKYYMSYICPIFYFNTYILFNINLNFFNYFNLLNFVINTYNKKYTTNYNIRYKSLILEIIYSKFFIVKSKLKSNLSFSNKKTRKQKGLGLARFKNKKSPISIKGIKYFKNNNIYKKIKINKKEWLLLLNIILFNKKTFIIIFNYLFLKHLKNYNYLYIFKYLHYFSIFTLTSLYIIFFYNIKVKKNNLISLKYIKLSLLLKFKYIYIII